MAWSSLDMAGGELWRKGWSTTAVYLVDSIAGVTRSSKVDGTAATCIALAWKLCALPLLRYSWCARPGSCRIRQGCTNTLGSFLNALVWHSWSRFGNLLQSQGWYGCVQTTKTVGGLISCYWRTCDRCCSGASYGLALTACTFASRGKHWLCYRHVCRDRLS